MIYYNKIKLRKDKNGSRSNYTKSNAKELNKTFDYNVPDSLENTIKIGSRVLVPFGNMKTLEDGFVIGLKAKFGI